MANADRILQQILGSGIPGGLAGGVAGGFLSQALMGKKGRKARKTLLKVGAVAAVGGIAYLAWKKYQEKKGTAAAPHPTLQPAVPVAPAGSKFLPAESDTAARDALGLTLMRAMIGAAKADGKLDGEESRKILGRIDELGLSGDDRALVLQELSQPADLDALAREAKSPEIASEIYVASRLAIDVDTDAERAYLQMLAARLQLDRDLVTELDRQVEAV